MAKIDLSDDEVVGVEEQGKDDSVRNDFSSLEGVIKSRFLKAEDAR